MSLGEARALLREQKRFDYVHGRCMKVDLSGKDLDPYLYDRNNGEGAARRIIAALRGRAPDL
jgi:hypothetical protein